MVSVFLSVIYTSIATLVEQIGALNCNCALFIIKSLIFQIQVTNSATSHRFGIIAAEDIRCSETLVEIPRSIAFTPGQSSIASRLRNFKERNVERYTSLFRITSILLFSNTLLCRVLLEQAFLNILLLQRKQFVWYNL